MAGIAASVAAAITDEAILHLEAPVLRVTAPDTVFPFAAAEDVWLPNETDVKERVKAVINF